MGKSIKKAVKSVTKAVTKTVKSVATAGTDGIKSALKGDIGGVADAMTRAATMGTVSLGDKGGVLNAGLTNEPKVETAETPTQAEADGLLQYVNDLRTRKSRRSRSSTNNTGGSSSGSNGNKLSGTTALGV